MKAILSLLTIILVCTTAVSPWSVHYLFNRTALEALPEIANAPKVKVESLEDFLLKEKDGLILEMAQIEKDAQKAELNKAAPLPEALLFKGGDAKTIRANFLRALRVNPQTPMGYFLQELPGNNLPGKKSNPETVSLFGQKDIEGKYRAYDIHKGDLVSPLLVVATAGDEPDFGVDINLFVDNNAPFSKDYGFGDQSFGDPKLYYGSQAPFHIGYYHESWIIFKAGSFLTRTYPRYRIHQFRNLAAFAFKTGHPYWGYRFLGWGMHYVGDLTQPYHARVLPTYGTMSMLWINIKAMMGFEQSKIDAVNRISERHTTIEDYHFSVLSSAFANHELNHPFITSLKVTTKDASYAPFSDSYVVDVVTEESEAIADDLDELIDKSNLLHGFAHGKLLPAVNKPALDELNKLISKHMVGVGTHLRNYVKTGMAGIAPKK